jgi:hypothetical protein
VHMCVFRLLEVKNTTTTELMYNGQWIKAFTCHFSFALLYSSLAFMCVMVDNAAAGSGVAEVKRLLHSHEHIIVYFKDLF